MRICSTSLMIREIEIQKTIKSVDKDIEKVEPSYFVDRNVNSPEIPFLSIQKEWKNTNMYTNAKTIQKKIQTCTQMFMAALFIISPNYNNSNFSDFLVVICGTSMQWNFFRQ